ncbi:MAG: TonB-dependent receptor [Prevotellaceae bacterium]|jgi:hypothetical protein|nr:TonB-dependent receptor [Prevotellaceae bacterium]
MGRFILLLAFFIFVFTLLNAQVQNVNVSGYVKSSGDRETIPDAAIYIKELNKAILVEADASYSITIPSGRYTFIVSCLGYITQEYRVNLRKETSVTQDFILVEDDNTLDAATVSAYRNDNVKRPQMGVERLNIEQIRAIPALMGEVDVIKSLQLLPGVQAASEGTSGFNVRGGTPDQNLILFDNAPMYNVSHLMGFFSAFNNDAVSDIQLYKGDIPVARGGRLSSLLEVNAKEGNMDKLTLTGGIGTISSRLTIEGPIVKDKLSYVISGRRTYADLFLKLSGDKDLKDTKLHFYDLNAKLTYKINDKNRLYFTGYAGNDKFGGNMADMNFGNQVTVLRWNHIFSDSFFYDLSLMATTYRYKMCSKIGDDDEYRWNSNIVDYTLRNDFGWLINPNMTFRFGLSSTFHNFRPGNAFTTSESVELSKNYALEHAIYASNEHKIGDRITLKYGARFSIFQNIGKATIYNFTPEHEKVDSTVYSKGDIFRTSYSFEPRIAGVFELNAASSIKASYSHAVQYLHLVSNSGAGSPLDVWVPTSPNIDPQRAQQASIGYFRNFPDKGIETSVEVYYKKMKNVVDFKDHARLILNPALDGELRIGDAEAYGLELMVKKTTGGLTGWISYTLSKSDRTIPEINNGKTYRSPADRPHNISVVATYEFSRRVSGSALWLYSSGIPVTYPIGKFEYNGVYIPVYGDRNASRMPDYHRLDLSLTVKGKEKPGKRWKGKWNFSLYNAYGRKNPWFIRFVQDKDRPSETYAEMIYLFSFVPSVTYNFKF